jgi:carboxylesterase
VVVCGLSMGSLLALHLAKNHPTQVRGVVALSNAMWLGNPWPTAALKLVDRLRLPDFWLSKSGPDLGDREQRAVHLTYDAQPIRAAISLLRAGEELSEQLHHVHAPTLLLHGARDAVAPVQNAFRVAVRLGTVDKRTVVFERSRHILTRDVDREAVRAELRRFLSRIAAA